MGSFVRTPYWRERQSSRHYTLSANIVEASGRAFTKPSTKKEPISTSTITKVCQQFAGPSCTLKGLRTALIFSLGFTGLFRVSELLDIKAQDIGIKDRKYSRLYSKN
jgi:site-specific recombinase XerD